MSKKEIKIKEYYEIKKQKSYNEIKKQKSYNENMNSNKKWKNNNDMNMTNIIGKIKYMQTKLQNSYDILLEEGTYKFQKIKALNTLPEEKINYEKKNKTDKISPLIRKFLKKTNNTIKEINRSTLDIVNLNYLYYLNKSSNYVNVNNLENKNRNKNIRIKNGNNIKNDININNYNFENESNIIKKIRNRSLLKNFVYINNNYHKQLNNAFMKFNPTTHLNNMKTLLEAVPSFHEDISKEMKDVDNDINYKNDKFKYKKKYANYINRKYLLSIKKPKIELKPKINKNRNRSVSLPKIRIKEEEIKENKKMNIPLNFLNKLQKDREKEFQKYKSNKLNELNQLITITGDINNLIDNSTIYNKLKNFMNDYNLIKIKAKGIKQNDCDFDLNKIDYFKPEKSLINQKLGSLYLKKYFNSIDKKEINQLNKLNSEMDIFINNNISNRNISLNEFDNFLLKNNVNIFEQYKK